MITFLICFLACIGGAICGIGGGVIIKPVLDAVSGMEISAINFLSGCTVLCMTSYSVLRACLSGQSHIELRIGTPLALGAAAGGVLGKELFQMLRELGGNSAKIGAIQAACLLLMTAGTLLYFLKKDKIITKHVESTGLCVLVGLSLGLLSSFLGIGGGPINLVVLVYFFSMDTKTAAENSLYIILFSQIASLFSSFAARSIPKFSLETLILMAAGGILGGICGQSINKTLDGQTVDRLFIALMIGIIVLNLWNLIRFVT